MAGVTDKTVRVYLNGEQIACNTFEKYVDLYLNSSSLEENQTSSSSSKKKEEDGSKEEEEEAEAEKKEDGEKEDKTTTEGAKLKPTKLYLKLNDRWEIAIAPSTEGTLMHVSFANSICTYKVLFKKKKKVKTNIGEQINIGWTTRESHCGTNFKVSFGIHSKKTQSPSQCY